MIIRIKKIFVLKKSSYNHPWSVYTDTERPLVLYTLLTKSFRLSQLLRSNPITKQTFQGRYKNA